MVKIAKSRTFTENEAAVILQTLHQMEADKAYGTDSRYIADSAKYPNNIITFAERHFAHLQRFPALDPTQYIANLRLMTKLRA